MTKAYRSLPRTWDESSINKSAMGYTVSDSMERAEHLVERNGLSANLIKEMSQMEFLPPKLEKPGRTGEIAKFYSSPRTKCTGKSSDHQSLTAHHFIYYTQSRIAVLSASEGQNCLVHMVDTKYISGFYYVNIILEKVDTLEEAFYKLFMCSKETTQTAIYLREWRSLKI